MNKKLITTGSLALVLVVLLGFIFFYEKPKMDNESESLQLFNSDEEVDISGVLFRPKGGSNFKILNSGGRWSLMEPYVYKLDGMSTDGLFDGLNDIKISEFVEEDAEDLDEYGLTNPEMQLEIFYADGQKNIMQIGDWNFDYTKRYIKKFDSKDVGYVDNELIKRFFITIDDIRDKHMLGLNANIISNIKYTNAENDVSLVKTGDEWIFEESNEDVIDKDKVDSWINKITNMKADSIYGFVEGSDVDQIELIGEVSIVLSDDSEHILRVFNSDEENKYFIVPEYTPTSKDNGYIPESFVYKIDKRIFDSVFSNKDTFIKQMEVTEE